MRVSNGRTTHAPKAVRTCVFHSPSPEFLLSPLENAANRHPGLERSSSEDSRPMEATLVDSTPAPPQADTAGPHGHMNYDSLENLLASHRSQRKNAASDENSEQDEQPLESHEVVELQAFIERKEWIGEKINVRVLISISPILACP